MIVLLHIEIQKTDAFPNFRHGLCNPSHGLSDFSHGLANP